MYILGLGPKPIRERLSLSKNCFAQTGPRGRKTLCFMIFSMVLWNALTALAMAFLSTPLSCTVEPLEKSAEYI